MSAPSLEGQEFGEIVRKVYGPLKGVRSEVIDSYEVPRVFYAHIPKLSAAKQAGTLGLLLHYGLHCGRMGRSRRTEMDVDKMVERWARVITGLAVAHDKDEADRYEAAVEECLTPLLAAPIRQIREFYPKLLTTLKSNPQVPFLVWRSYELWVEQVIAKAGDEEVRELKTAIAREITDLVEQDIKEQLPEALVRALQWRSAQTLEEVKEAVTRDKAKGRKARLVGRESCLFLHCGGEGEDSEVCVQI
jgi:hypothetical protein